MAVKPQVLKQVAQCVQAAIKASNPLVITICAGVMIGDLTRWLSSEGYTPSVVRVMPNTPALVQEGATGLYATKSVTVAQKELAFAVMKSVSKTNYWVESEAMLDVVTGLSGKLHF